MRGFTTPETVHNSILIINLSDAKKYSILKKENLPLIPSDHGKIMKHMKKINQRTLSCSPKRWTYCFLHEIFAMSDSTYLTLTCGVIEKKKRYEAKKRSRGQKSAPRGKKSAPGST